MKTARMLGVLVLAVGLMVCQAKVGEAVPIGTSFTYQGHLYDANYVANGGYDFQFALYDSNDPCVGSQVGSDVNKADVDVIDGYFTVELDFNDANAFNGDARWLEIGVRPGEMNDPNGYTPLSPLQEVTPTPYALHTRWFLVDETLDNIFAGEGAGASNTTGFRNSAMGSAALYSNTTGHGNSAIGNQALYSNTTGSDNSAMGYHALRSNTTGSWNSAVGGAALRFNTTGNFNSAMGYYANLYNQEGSRNTIIGYEAGRGTSPHNKSGNVFLGYQAGYYETGDNKLYIANGSADANVLIYGDFNTGRVGIGTTSPTATIDVNGTLALQDGPAINEVSTDGTLADNSDSAVPTEQAVKTYVDAQAVSAGVGVVPIGGVVAWAKSFPNTPSLPANFEECNGQTITDSNSPYDGQTIPNLNTGTQRFLRGSTTSGTTGGSETHTHSISTNTKAQSKGTGANDCALLNHNHGGATGSQSTLPSYYEVAWIMRVK